MERKSYSFFLIRGFFWFMVLHSIPEYCLAARKLLDIFPSGNEEMTPPPSPRTNVTYESETRNGTHGQIVYVNGQPRSQSATVHGKTGKPVVQAFNHAGSQTGKINGVTGKPVVQAANTINGQSGTINGKDGKPQIEVHKYDNGTADVTFYGNDGKPIYHLNYQTPPGSNTGNSFNIPPVPPGLFTPPSP